MHIIEIKDATAVFNMTERDYRKASGLSQSSLKDFCVSPKHYIESIENPKEPTKDMIFGTCFHSLMLDETLCYAVREKLDMRKNADKERAAEWELQNAGKIAQDDEAEARLQGMKKSILDGKESVAHKLYKETKKEHRGIALFGTAVTPFGDVRIKGLLDGWLESEGIIWDFKKCQSAQPYEFEKMVRERGYWLQSAQYQMLAKSAGLRVEDFIFIPVEDKAPHCFASYSFDIYKQMKYQKYAPIARWSNAICEFAECQANGNWHGYNPARQVIEI